VLSAAPIVALVLASSFSDAPFISFNAPSNERGLVAVSIAHTGLRRHSEFAEEARLEYRSSERLWIFKPFGGVMASSVGTLFAFVGVLIDFYLGSHLVLTPSFAPGFYSAGKGKDLGFPLEFRSQVELAFRFWSGARIGVGVNHISNAKLGHINPGIEAVSITFSMPGG
jgi:lipid A 3-O-deacylase